MIENIKDFIFNLPQTKIIHSIIVIVISFLIYNFKIKFLLFKNKIKPF